MVRGFVKNNVALFVAIGTCIVAFVVVALAARAGILSGVDYNILAVVRTLAAPTLDQVVPVVTMLGDAVFVAIITVLLALGFAARGRLRQATLLLFGVGGAAVINVLLKHIADRTRPELWQHLVTETSHSFPSGHATASMALALCIVVLAWSTKWRALTITLAVVYVAVIALTRLYAGVHYPTDIVAGWLVTAAWVGIVCVILRSIRQRKAAQ